MGFDPHAAVILRVEKRREMFIPILAAVVVVLLYIAMRIAKVRFAPVTVYEIPASLDIVRPLPARSRTRTVP